MESMWEVHGRRGAVHMGNTDRRDRAGHTGSMWQSWSWAHRKDVAGMGPNTWDTHGKHVANMELVTWEAKDRDRTRDTASTWQGRSEAQGT